MIDLRRVTFMDSTGINILIAPPERHGAGGWLRLAAPTDCHPTLRETLNA
ncbi:hypothetical protein [Streptomyces canus]|nr:hypothetical protein [Streptomyces canus]